MRALPAQFHAGGRVHNAGVDVAHVRLRFADGVVLEDDTDQVAAPERRLGVESVGSAPVTIRR